MKHPNSFSIQRFNDHRGEMEFCNEFDFSRFKRFYIISPDHQNQIRAWQGHKHEEKVFLILSGKIKLVFIPVIDFEKVLLGKPIEFQLDIEKKEIIHLPGGFLNGFQFLSSDAKVMVFSSYTLEESKNDDFRFDYREFYDWKEND